MICWWRLVFESYLNVVRNTNAFLWVFSVRVFVLVVHCAFSPVLPSVQLSVVCAHFINVFVWFLLPLGICSCLVFCLLSFLSLCVCGFYCGPCYLYFLPLLLFITSLVCWFPLVCRFCIFCECVWWSFLMGGRFHCKDIGGWLLSYLSLHQPCRPLIVGHKL